MKRFSSVFFCISIALFIGGIILGLLGRGFCTRSNDSDYQKIQPESFVPDTIEIVLHDEELKQLYVCYNDANCVNVYTETGEFLWCVSTPYLRNSYFVLQDGKLIICDGDAYIYHSKTGSFLGVEKEESLDLQYDWEKDYTGQFIEGNYYFDNFRVYKATDDDSLEVIVSRPWWHHILSFEACLCIAFIGMAGILISMFYDKAKNYKGLKKTVVFRNRKARIMKDYFKTTTIVHLVYTGANIIFAFITDWLIIGIIPLTIHMIVSNIILWNLKDRVSYKSEEMCVVEFWSYTEIASFIMAFISVIIASAIAG